MSETRRYVRHATTGDLGWLTTEDGRDMVQKDSGGPLINYRPDDWYPEDNHRRMTVMQSAHVAFQADRQLCHYLGFVQKSRVEWIDLTDDQRIHFRDFGPHGTRARRKLWAYVMKALKEMEI